MPSAHSPSGRAFSEITPHDFMFLQLHSVFTNAGSKYVGSDLIRVWFSETNWKKKRGAKLLRT